MINTLFTRVLIKWVYVYKQFRVVGGSANGQEGKRARHIV